MGVVLGWSAVGSTIGPLVGGALAEHNWRWVFYITLPFSGVVLVWVVVFLRLKYRRTVTRAQALNKMDLGGDVLFIGSNTANLLGFLMSGVTFPWFSANVVAPLVLGVVGGAAFLVYESRIAEPTVPRRLFHHQNATIGLFLTVLTGVFLASPA